MQLFRFKTFSIGPLMTGPDIKLFVMK